jgi:hypothetical protein
MIGNAMPTHQVNLDSLIIRQPFESVSDASVMGTDPLFKLEELQRTKMYFVLLRSRVGLHACAQERTAARINPACHASTIVASVALCVK